MTVNGVQTVVQDWVFRTFCVLCRTRRSLKGGRQIDRLAQTACAGIDFEGCDGRDGLFDQLLYIRVFLLGSLRGAKPCTLFVECSESDRQWMWGAARLVLLHHLAACSACVPVDEME